MSGKEVRRSIALVDGDVEFLEILTMSLMRKGYDPVPYHSYYAALEGIASGSYPAVVSESVFSGEDKVKEIMHHAGKSTSVIFLTGYPGIRLAMKALREGACDYMMKPLELDLLVDKLDRIYRAKNL